MWDIAGTTMALAGYTALVVFSGRVTWRFFRWISSPPGTEPGSKRSAASVALGVWDVLFLRRLFLVNKALWIGEWIFHVSFILVLLRHLRYFLNPVPAWIMCVQPVGIWAGYALGGAGIFVLAMRYLVQRKEYASRENLLLTLTILGSALTGLAMRWIGRPDIIGVKSYVLHALAFSLERFPVNGLLLFHGLLACLLLPILPTHILTAPYITYDARRREELLGGLLHD